MPNPSPLRYPGGKNRLAGFIRLVIQNLNMPNCTYVEPFAGGAGVALSLLLDNTVDRIVINDYDKAIYSFWRAVKQEPASLIDLIQSTPITIDEWYRQKEIYSTSTSYSLNLAFATLFLNRTNRSGILNAGPIGGYAQDGEWKLDVRFDKEALIAKIELIARERERISVYNKDIISLLRNYAPRLGDNLFFYFDPPYYNCCLFPCDFPALSKCLISNAFCKHKNGSSAFGSSDSRTPVSFLPDNQPIYGQRHIPHGYDQSLGQDKTADDAANDEVQRKQGNARSQRAAARHDPNPHPVDAEGQAAENPKPEVIQLTVLHTGGFEDTI